MDIAEYQREIAQQLQGKTRQQIATFALRAACRALPFLVRPQDGKAFSYWQDERKKHLLAVLRAHGATVLYAARGDDPALITLYRKCRSDAWSAAGAAAYAYAAAYATDAADAAYAAYAVTYAADAAAAAVAYATASIMPFMIQQSKQDLILLSAKKEYNLLCSPLWNLTSVKPSFWARLPKQQDDFSKAHALWQTHYTAFKTAALALDPAFSFWLDWYEDRLAGKPISVEQQLLMIDYPDEIAADGPAKLRAYLQARMAGGEEFQLNRVRCMFIGNGFAGKTSLIRALHGEEVVEGKELMTVGVENREWKLAVENAKDQPILAHFWDFGGQVMFHAMHQLFLRSHCVYVLLLTARAESAESAEEQAEYWLRHIQTYAENAPVLLVGNKCDEALVHIDIEKLRSKFGPHLIGFYPLACTQAKEGQFQSQFAQFKQDLCGQLVAAVRTRLDGPQYKVLQAVQTLARENVFLKEEHFLRLCEENQIGDAGELNREWLLDFFDKLGIVIHFKKIPMLKEYVLTPRWLTKGVYALINAQKARLDLDEVIALLHKLQPEPDCPQHFAYEKDKCQFIIMAMEQFQLCYKVQRSALQPNLPEQWVIPGSFSPVAPAGMPAMDHWQQSADLCLKYQFTNFIPRQLIVQCIVSLHASLREEGGQTLAWSRAAAFQNGNCDALMEVDYSARNLRIAVKDRTGGDGAQHYLRKFCDVVEDLLKDLAIERQQWLFLPESALMPDQQTTNHVMPDQRAFHEDWAAYSQIEKALKRGKPDIISNKGLEYQLDKIFKMYWPKNQQAGEMTMNVYGGNANMQQIAHRAGDQIIHDGEFHNSVSNVGEMSNSQISSKK